MTEGVSLLSDGQDNGAAVADRRASFALPGLLLAGGALVAATISLFILLHERYRHILIHLNQFFYFLNGIPGYFLLFTELVYLKGINLIVLLSQHICFLFDQLKY